MKKTPSDIERDLLKSLLLNKKGEACEVLFWDGEKHPAVLLLTKSGSWGYRYYLASDSRRLEGINPIAARSAGRAFAWKINPLFDDPYDVCENIRRITLGSIVLFDRDIPFAWTLYLRKSVTLFDLVQ